MVGGIVGGRLGVIRVVRFVGINWWWEIIVMIACELGSESVHLVLHLLLLGIQIRKLAVIPRRIRGGKR